jgi:hypothetical protein
MDMISLQGKFLWEKVAEYQKSRCDEHRRNKK